MPVNDMSRIPSFGFESKNMRAKTVEDKIANKAVDKGTKKALTVLRNFAKAVNPDATEAEVDKVYMDQINERYGSLEDYKKKTSKRLYKSLNASKCAGYIPGVGVFTGLGKIVEAIKERNNKTYNTPTLLLRATGEILGVGIVFLPIDKYVTHKRQKKWAELN